MTLTTKRPPPKQTRLLVSLSAFAVIAFGNRTFLTGHDSKFLSDIGTTTPAQVLSPREGSIRLTHLGCAGAAPRRARRRPAGVGDPRTSGSRDKDARGGPAGASDPTAARGSSPPRRHLHPTPPRGAAPPRRLTSARGRCSLAASASMCSGVGLELLGSGAPPPPRSCQARGRAAGTQGPRPVTPPRAGRARSLRRADPGARGAGAGRRLRPRPASAMPPRMAASSFLPPAPLLKAPPPGARATRGARCGPL